MAFQEASSSPTSSSSYFTASSSSFTGQWAYDVFLSFRGRDTRNNFIAHLYEALIRMGINTYKDKDLERGKNILPALLTAIEDSKIAVIVFSQNYASSSWCLEELSKIVECKEKKEQIVLPVFYKVDPSEVRQQKKSFEEAFTKHEERFKDDQKKVQKWKTNLTKVANLSGWHLGDENEAEFIGEIIKSVKSKLVQNPYYQVAKHPIGIELPEHTEQRDRTKLQSSAGDKPKMHECSIHCLEIAKGQALGGHMRRHRATINQGLSPITLIDSKVPAVLKRVMRLDDLNLKPSENNLKLLFGRKAMS